MIILGLTGSLAMGKSTCAKIFEAQGIPVHEADHAVHEALANDPECFAVMKEAFPPEQYPAIYKKNEINRKTLGDLVFNDDKLREKLETVIHPFVWASQNAFIKKHQTARARLVVLDIPLLYETGAETRVNYVAVASAPQHVQKARALERVGMTEARLNKILQRQMSDSAKRSRADFIIPTGLGMAHTATEIKKLIKTIVS